MSNINFHKLMIKSYYDNNSKYSKSQKGINIKS